MPFIIEDHDKERCMLERRLLLLSILDDFVRDERELDELENDPDFQRLSAQFKSVLNPCDVCESIKAIYPPHLFGPDASNSSNASNTRFSKADSASGTV